MRLIIIPIDKNFEAEEEGIVEIETNSEEEIIQTLSSIIKGKSYSIETYKNLNDFLIFHIDIEKGVSFYLKDKQEYKYMFNDSAYENTINFIKTYVQPGGSQILKQLFLKHNEKIKKKEKEKFNTWKVKYQNNLKKEKKKNTIKYALFFTVFGVISFIIYLVFINELRFIGRENMYKNGVIINTQFRHMGSGYYTQTVFYEFTYQGKKYSNSFEAGKRLGKQFEGDSIMVKFRKSNPEISKYIKTIYE